MIEFMLTKKKKKKWNKKFEPKIKITFRKYNFGLIKIALITLFISLIFQTTFTSLQIFQAPTALLVTNLLKTYILGGDLWTAIAFAHTYFLQTIIYNNTVPCWEEKFSLECYKESDSYFENSLLDRLTECASYDLGNLTKNYSETLTEVKKIIIFFLR